MAMHRLKFNSGKNIDELVPTESTAMIIRKIKIINNDKMFVTKLLAHISSIIDKGDYYREKIIAEVNSLSIYSMN